MDIAVLNDNGNHPQLISQQSPKPKILIVDDEPDNLDLLYRTFRRDFNILRAESGISALEILAIEGEVAVIISDQRMPEMKGTEFLSKTVPQFPNTMRIILTGFTDVEDLVEAINSGQVYKYITKPWNPDELKAVVQRAAETYELVKHRTDELRRAQTQTALLSAIVQAAKEFTTLETVLTPIATAFGQTFGADRCILQRVNQGLLGSEQGSYRDDGYSRVWLSHDPLVKTAIVNQAIQLVSNIPTDRTLSQVPHYKDSTTQAHLVVPISFRNQVLAALSLQWKTPHVVQEEEVSLLQVAAQQVAIALACARHDRDEG